MVEFLLGLLSNLISSLLGKINIPRFFPTSQTKFWDPIFKGNLVIVTPAEEQEANIKSQVYDFQGLDELKLQVIDKYYKGKEDQQYQQDADQGDHHDPPEIDAPDDIGIPS